MSSVPLPYLSVARVTGADAGTFLQAQLSADIGALGEGQANYACYCSPRGQVFGLLLVIRTADEYVAVGAARLLPGMVERLRMYVLRAKAHIALDSELTVVGFDGADVAPAGARAFSPTGIGLTYGLQREGPAPGSGADRWRQRELERGVAWLGPETTERFIPQMLGFDRIGAVSFSKGCYPGQEIIARAKHLGRVKRRPLFLLAGSGSIPAGASVRLIGAEQAFEGTVVDSVPAAEPGDGPASESLLMVVAPEPSGPVETLEHGGRSYRCATM